MRVKQDAVSGGGTDVTAGASSDTGSKPSDGLQRQGSPEMDDGDMDNIFNDPHFLSIMQQYSYPYPQQGSSSSLPFGDQFQVPPYSTAQYPGAQYPPNQYMPFDIMDMIDDDDDEDEEIYINSNVFPPQALPSKSKSQASKSVRARSNTVGKPPQPPASATSSLVASPVSQTSNSRANSRVNSRATSPSSSVSLHNMDFSDSGSGKEEGRKSVESTVLVNESSASGLASVANQQNQIATLHSYSLPVVNTPGQPTSSGQLGDVIYTDGSILNNPNVSLVEIVTTQSPLSMDTSQVLAVTSSASSPVQPTSQVSPSAMTSPVHVMYDSSPDSAGLTTSPLPADIIISAAGGSSKAKGKSSSKRGKSSSSSSSSQRKKTKSGDAQETSGISFTPVETITNIVDPSKLVKDELLKEVITKPIRHQSEISIDKAHNRSVKNAINARVNRQKHKNFVQSLEEENDGLRQKIAQLENYTDVLKTEKDVLNQEIHYLKSVIANETSIGSVLSGLGNVKNVRLSSGFTKKYRKRAADSTMSESSSSDSKMSRDSGIGSDVTAGVCLHVHDESVSVEFCEQCAAMAAEGRS